MMWWLETRAKQGSVEDYNSFKKPLEGAVKQGGTLVLCSFYSGFSACFEWDRVGMENIIRSLLKLKKNSVVT